MMSPVRILRFVAPPANIRFIRRDRSGCGVVVTLAFGALMFSATALSETARRFEVQDDIGLNVLNPGFRHRPAFSNDGRFFALQSERGDLSSGLVEDSLWVYRTAEASKYLASPGSSAPSPAVVVKRSARKAPVIVDWQWSSSGSTIAFIDNSDPSHRRLYAVDIAGGAETPLTPECANVGEYDLRDAQNYTYTRRVDTANDREGALDVPAVVETGRSLFSILFPAREQRYSPLAASLVVVRGGVARELRRGGIAITRQREAWLHSRDLVVSPDGSKAITEWSVESAPASWEQLYLPMARQTAQKIYAGNLTGTFVQVDLRNGDIRPVIDAPSADAAGWWLDIRAVVTPSWSSDGRHVLFPASYVPSRDGAPSEPCVALFDTRTDKMTCIDQIRRSSNFPNVQEVMERAEFVGGRWNRIRVEYRLTDERIETRSYEARPNGGWTGRLHGIGESQADRGSTGPSGLAVSIVEDLNTAPRVEVTRGSASRILLEPNSGLSLVRMGKAELYQWNDGHGRSWRGGLYLPPDFEAGVRYPLVIQTHGFESNRFVPSGYAPTAFSARALASHDIVVLQVDERCGASSEEMDCAVAAYESAVRKLTAEGIADPLRVGLIGFSRTCLYVMRTLTASRLSVAAASVTDGVTGSYWQYNIAAGFFNDMHARDEEIINQAQPIGAGLQKWLERSPEFNLDKVAGPLLVNGLGPDSLTYMWDIYAGLHFLHKPVELVMLNIDEHVLSNPRVRLASQGGTVDWFRFWLKGEEDPDPVKAEQYRRWRGLRSLQSAGDGTTAAGSGASSTAVACSPPVVKAQPASTRGPTLRCTGAG